MKRKIQNLFIALGILSTPNFQLSTLHAQGTAFTYQGRLNDGANPANGNYDFQFILFDTNQFGFPAAPVLTNANVSVNNGLFTATLDFGGIFTGTNFWLDISVRTNGGGAFAELSPRQTMTPAPYAITAENLAGVVENNLIQSAPLATIGGGAGNAIQTGANFATIGGGGNNVIQNGADHSTIGGGSGNGIEPGAFESFVGGGQGNLIYSVWSAIGGGLDNVILTNANFSFIGGGRFNSIQPLAYDSTIGGGQGNQILTNAYDSTISGGLANQIQTNAAWSAIGGGYANVIQANSSYSTIPGGFDNTIQYNAYAAMIGGGRQNQIQTNAYDSTIGGGFENVVQNNASGSTIGGGSQNMIQPSQSSTISGGFANAIQTNSSYATIGGGGQNQIQVDDEESTIGGGYGNVIQTNDEGATISGGHLNTILPSAGIATIGGGDENQILSGGMDGTIAGGTYNTNNGDEATIGGGYANTVNGSLATVPGGFKNLAGGSYSFAAGRQAQALHQGAFVWADSSSTGFASTTNDEFLILATGGVGINTNNPNGTSLRAVGNRNGGWGSPVVQFENTSGASGSSPALRVVVDGGTAPDGALSVSDNGTGPIAEFGNGIGFVVTIDNDGTITTSKGVVLTSDKNAKENFTALDTKMVLAKVIAMPVTEWNYKDDAADKKHMGPVAQDFHSAFGLDGADDKHISVVDEGGVALAAIQGLNQKLEQELQLRDAENAELKQRLEMLEKIVHHQLTAR